MASRMTVEDSRGSCGWTGWHEIRATIRVRVRVKVKVKVKVRGWTELWAISLSTLNILILQ